MIVEQIRTSEFKNVAIQWWKLNSRDRSNI